MNSIYEIKKHNAVFSNNTILLSKKANSFDSVVFCPAEFQKTAVINNNVFFGARPPIKMFYLFVMWFIHIMILKKTHFALKGVIDID